MDFTANRIRAILKELEEHCWKNRCPVEKINTARGNYTYGKTFDRNNFAWQTFGRDETWGGTDWHQWFLADIPGKAGIQEEPLYVIVSTGANDMWNTDNPQIIAYRNGYMSATMDMNHQVMCLADSANPASTYETAFYAYTNGHKKSDFFRLDTAVPNQPVIDLYFDMKVLFEAAELMESEELVFKDIMDLLSFAADILDLRRIESEAFYKSVKEAREYLKKNRYDHPAGMEVTVHSIGHTHIDVAWKWPLRQTRQKVVRSFQTVLNLMDRYPSYKFMSSQPQLYQFVMEDAPWLFEKIRQKVKEGRWEAEGGMWLEPDCNLSSGESLVRHLIYGTRFFEEELDALPNEVLWLPDVFGYSAALPQIMKQFHMPYFMTTKLGWNDHNQFPNDTFLWRGIDGSQVLTHMITTKNYDKENKKDGRNAFNTTYNGLQNPSQIKGTWQRYQNKEVSRNVLTCYGYGDGGGGPTAQMLEQDERLSRGVPGCPVTKQSFVKDFFHILEQNLNRSKLPVWHGELYLEYHRGTYTSMANNKKNNRKCEFLNQDVEFFSVLAGRLISYPRTELEHCWKLLLLNQFHDILPGSSIADVYEDSDRQYEEIQTVDGELIQKAQNVLLKEQGARIQEENADGIALWNTLSFERTEILELSTQIQGISGQKSADGKWLYLLEKIPPKSMCIIKKQNKKNKEKVMKVIDKDENGHPIHIRTPFYEIELNVKGEFTQIKDITEDRELMKMGERGNRIRVFEDKPMEFDSWNIDPYYEAKSWDWDDTQEFRVTENGPYRACIQIRRQFMDSWMEQKIYFYSHTGRIDFRTKLDWKEHQLLVKAEFPVDILAVRADYEIQFGNVERPTHKNTTWDQAMFEVCAHKWADLAEPGYGTSILNDCRYGYDIHDSIMRLTLLKSGIFPNPNADVGLHEFTYALFPHTGDYREGKVVQEAYRLNCPLYGQAVQADQEYRFSFMEIQEENVIAETLKAAEDGNGVIVRLYEAYGKRGNIHISFADKWNVAQTDLPEKEYKLLQQENGEVILNMRPFEIKTLRLEHI